jgi:hypothetical protein
MKKLILILIGILFTVCLSAQTINELKYPLYLGKGTVNGQLILRGSTSGTFVLAVGATGIATATGTIALPSTTSIGTVSAAEILRLSGVTSPIQTQLNAKISTVSPTFTGEVTIPTPFTLGATSVTATGAQLNNLVSMVNVKDYGAIGNGITDDQAAINTALAVVANGGAIYFPEGTYLTGGGHILPDSNIVVYGVSGMTILKSKYDNAFFVDKVGGNKNITIRDLKFDRNGKETVALNFSNAGTTNLVIKNCVFYGSELTPELATEAYIYTQNVVGLKIMDCHFIGQSGSLEFGTYLYNGTSEILISGCTFNTMNCGIFVKGITALSHSVSVVNNAFYNTKYYGVRFDYAENGTITGNTFYGFTDPASGVDGPTATQILYCKNITVANNTMDGAGIGLYFGFRNSAIGNIIKHAKISAIEVNNVGDAPNYEKSYGTVVSNNVIRYGDGSAIFVEGRNIIVTGNYADSLDASGIEVGSVDSTQNVLITDNIISNVGLAIAWSDGIKIGYGTELTQVYDNIRVLNNTIIDTYTTPRITQGINFAALKIFNSQAANNVFRFKVPGSIYEYKYNESSRVDLVGEIHTVKRSIGHPGHTTSDFTFTSINNSDAQEFDFGHVIPAGAKVLNIQIICTQALAGSGAHEILFRAGNATTGQQFLADISCDEDYEVAGTVTATVEAVAMNYVIDTHVWIGANPDANWDTYTAGKWDVLITYIDYLTN